MSTSSELSELSALTALTARAGTLEGARVNAATAPTAGPAGTRAQGRARSGVRTRAEAGAAHRGLGRSAGIAALAVMLLHVLVSVQHAHDALFSLLVGLMALGCVACSVACLRAPCRREITALLVMSALMILLHLGWMLTSGPGGHVHGGAESAAVGPTASGMGLSMLGLCLAELLVAALCAAALRRGMTTESDV